MGKDRSSKSGSAAALPPYCVQPIAGLVGVQKVDPWWFLKVGIYLGNLAELPPGTTVTSGYRIAEYARMALRTIAGQPEIPLPKCRLPAQRLLADIEAVFAPPDHEISPAVLEDIARKVNQLLTMIQADIADTDVFQVQRIAIYKTRDLLERADGNLNNAAQASIPEATRADLRAAGACLAFHQFTASGFHSLRATESEARRYYTLVTGNPVGLELSFGKVASYLVNQYTSAETEWVKGGKGAIRHHDLLGVIGQLLVRINGMFRNPIMHPEATLDGDTAIEVFGLACRVISAIAEDTNARRPREAQ
jgi:hypothetical protein